MKRPWRVVAQKEIRETLRDRRTIIPMVVLPVVLYPAVFLLIFQVASAQRTELEAKTSRVLVEGAARANTALDAQDKLEIRTWEAPDAPAERQLASGAVDVVVRWPAGADATLDAAASPAPVEIHFDKSLEESRLARDRVVDALADWSQAEVERRLRERGLPAELHRPLAIESTNAASAAQMGGWLLGQILPLFVVMMVALGAFYPAVDLTAGERERGTLLTLLTAPMSATQAVLGKFAAVLLLAFLTAAFNIGSVALFFGHGSSLFDAMAGEFEVDLAWYAWLGLLATSALFGAFLSALMMSVAVLARTFKEAQSYLTPVYLLAVLPAVVAQLPGIELSAATALAPGVNVALLIKAFLLDRARADATFLVFASTLVYTAAILAFAARLFQRETVVLGEGGWRELWRGASSPGAHPLGPTDALGLFAGVFVLFYYASAWMGAKLDWPPLVSVPAHLVLFVALPTLAYVRWRAPDIREALGWQWPRRHYWPAALLLGASAWAPIGWLVEQIQQPTLPLPAEDLARFAELLAPAEGTWGLIGWIAALAVAPALCEELLFRGVVLRGLLRGARPLAAIAVSAALFGAMHLSLYRFAGTFALGLVAGTVAYRSGSLGPAMLFHFANNATALLFAYLFASVGAGGAEAGSDAATAAAAGIPAEAALACLPVALLAGWWLFRLPVRAAPRSAPPSA